MFKFISRNILTGFITLLPVVLTVYLFYWFTVSTESALKRMVHSLFPGSPYWPGIGLVGVLLFAFILGLLMHTYVAKQLFLKAESILYRMPLIKSVYGAIRDFFQYFSPASKKEFEQVVAVTLENGMQLIGFVTQAEPEKMPEGFRNEESVLVYLPLSYMIGGFAVLVPKKMVRPINMNMEEAMRFTLTAGVTGANNPTPDKK
jgi:uncharacterized membrane protein